MATDVTAEILVDRPRSAVAGYMLDWRNDRAWIRSITDVTLVTDGTFGVGSRVARVAKFLGRRIEYVNEVTRLEPGTLLEMRSVKSPFPMVVTYEFDEEGDGTTRTSVRVQGDPSALYRLAGPLMSRKVRKSVAADLETLKRILQEERTR